MVIKRVALTTNSGQPIIGSVALATVATHRSVVRRKPWQNAVRCHVISNVTVWQLRRSHHVICNKRWLNCNSTIGIGVGVAQSIGVAQRMMNNYFFLFAEIYVAACQYRYCIILFIINNICLSLNATIIKKSWLMTLLSA